MADYDLIIVGGGIGGSALAAVLARAGRDVLLLEQTEVFEDRVRGEWIAPWGVVETRRLGLFDTLKAQKKLRAHVERNQQTINAKAEIMLEHFIQNNFTYKMQDGSQGEIKTLK